MADSFQKLFDKHTSTACLAWVDGEELGRWSRRYFHAHLARFLPASKSAHILDIGCGHGRYLRVIKDLGYENHFGIDMGKEQICYAREVLHLENVCQANAIPWLEGREASFDCILAMDILEHLPLDDLLLLGQRIFSALKPGGILIAQIPNGVSPLNPNTYADLTHLRAFTVPSIRQWFLFSGLSPRGYHEIPPLGYSGLTLTRKLLWRFFSRPMIHLFMLLIHGKCACGIYSNNFIAVAEKPG
jgi:2-polyprenyl-3-methyl-5-hydroxy-6-metoxy-1,4-benzoquinol methylase